MKLAFLGRGKGCLLPENGFLTPTMKLKRRVLESTYGQMADAWYGESVPVVCNADWKNKVDFILVLVVCERFKSLIVCQIGRIT